MNDESLRAMIRETVARRLGDAGRGTPVAQPLAFAVHPSHFRYTLPESGGTCLIEPAVRCNHCGYCQSHGH
jgi:nitroimidazol reductase NimA-like FMN-containing flavoprotein (pyridoxamine 5'-phosphate oxidase superfamily)